MKGIVIRPPDWLSTVAVRVTLVSEFSSMSSADNSNEISGGESLSVMFITIGVSLNKVPSIGFPKFMVISSVFS